MKPDDFKPITLAEHQDYESWLLLLYAKTKSGKTWFCGTAGPRTLYINTGDGLATLKSPEFLSKYPDSKNMIVQDFSEDIRNGKANAFDLICDYIDWAFEYRKDDFDTVILDDATALRRYARNKAFDLNNQQRNSPRPNRIQNYQKTEIGDYGIEMDMILWFLGNYIEFFKENRKNFVMTAHERHIFGKPANQGAEAPLIAVKPSFTGKSSPDDVAAFFDEVWRMEAIGGGTRRQYRAITIGNEIYAGGSRHNGIFKEKESNPNFLEMLSRIRAGKLITP